MRACSSESCRGTKIPWGKPRAGSSPAPGTTIVATMTPDGTQFGEYHLEVADVILSMQEAAGRWGEAHLELLKQSEASGRLLKILPNPRNEAISRRLRQKDRSD